MQQNSGFYRFINLTGSMDFTDREKPGFYWTGHPFIDAGLTAVLLIAEKEKPEDLTKKDIEKAIEFASELYATKENSSYLHNMIFPNNGILMSNPGMSRKRSSESIAENLQKIFYSYLSNKLNTKTNKNKEEKDRSKKDKSDNDSDSNSDNVCDVCDICGRKPVYTEKNVYFSIFPLVGTGNRLNFFHSANFQGISICTHCIFLTQFMPLACYRFPSKVLLIHAYPYKLMLQLSQKAFNNIKKNRLIQTEKFREPGNFLFYLAEETTGNLERSTEKDDLWKNASITLYCFACNLRNQDLNIIHVPSAALRFAVHASSSSKLASDWKRIVMAGWGKQPENGIEVNINKKINRDRLEKLQYQKPNMVYAKLLNNESIFPYFFNPRKRRVNAGWNLLALYYQEVIGMEKEILDFIKDIGDKIVETFEKLPENRVEDEIRNLERADKFQQFENFLVNIEKLRYALGIKDPLMDFDKFTRLIFTDREDTDVSWISWKTIKNLIRFRVYERLQQESEA